MHPTPDTSHLSREDFDRIYEPAEDTFILLDALEETQQQLLDSEPTICLEIGSGSGIVSAFTTSLLSPRRIFSISTDINSFACRATQTTAMINGAGYMDTIHTDLTGGLLHRLHGLVDILIFNPPYVPTCNEELLTSVQSDIRTIYASWAGGHHGMDVTNRLLDQVKYLLSPSGSFFLVCVDQNKPQEIMTRMEKDGFSSKVVLKRLAGCERLCVIRFQKQLRMNIINSKIIYQPNEKLS